MKQHCKTALEQVCASHLRETVALLVVMFLRNLKKEELNNRPQYFLNYLQLPVMRSGHSGAHVQNPVVILVWRELEDARAFVKFLNWGAMVPKRM